MATTGTSAISAQVKPLYAGRKRKKKAAPKPKTSRRTQ